MSRATRPGCLIQQEDPEAWHLGDRVQAVCVWLGAGAPCLIETEGREKMTRI